MDRRAKGAGHIPEDEAMEAALKPPVAEGGPSASPMGEPPGLVPGVGGRGAASIAAPHVPSPSKVIPTYGITP